tara:strand:- start:8987 stop:9241 length:255 start_codon:yes stop_codon:yes gene_type:complete
MVAKRFQNKTGGLNEAGRKKFGVKRPLSSGKSGRRVSFAARFSGVKGPMKDKKGRPTRLALALKKWGFSSRSEARAFANKNKRT